jgi:hypothetical protein
MRRKETHRLILIISLLLFPVSGIAQEIASPNRQRAVLEIESVLVEANSITDKLDLTRVRAKAANLVWLEDRPRSLRMFEELWAWVEGQDSKNFDREAARTEVLKNLLPRNPAAATALLEKLKADGASPDSRQLNDLASGLLDDDPATAAGLLEQSLSNHLSPVNIALLVQLRKKDVDAANGIASRVLAALNTRPTTGLCDGKLK